MRLKQDLTRHANGDGFPSIQLSVLFVLSLCMLTNEVVRLGSVDVLNEARPATV